jgi:PAS domain-containing protein
LFYPGNVIFIVFCFFLSCFFRSFNTLKFPEPENTGNCRHSFLALSLFSDSLPFAFQADENFIPVFLHGTVEEITGYSEEEFMSRRRWKDIIHPKTCTTSMRKRKMFGILHIKLLEMSISG